MVLTEKLTKRIEGYRDAMIKLQADMTAIPAIDPGSGGDGEFEKAEFLKGILKDYGFTDIKVFNAPDERCKSKVRPNIVAIYPGKSSKKTFWIMGHTDVVPPGDLSMWESDPYKLVVKGDRIIGRGVEDNQQAIVTAMFAVKALFDEKMTPEYNVGVILAADEETGSQYGIGHVVKNHPEIFTNDDIVVVPDAGNPDGTMIEVAEKSIMWMKIKTKGVQCHGSRPDLGHNAHKANAYLIVKFDQLYKDFPGHDQLFTPAYSTFEATKKETNVPNVNTIPGEDVFYVDCRVIPYYDLKDVLAKMRAYADEIEREFSVKVEITFPQKEQAAPATSMDAEVVKLLSDGIKEVYGKTPKPEGIGGGTVAAFFRRAGIPCAVWSRIDEVCHQPNEYCKIDNMIGDTKVFVHAICSMK